MGELRQRGGIWWIRYYRNGRRHEESSGSTKKGVAIDVLKIREGDGAKGIPVTPKIGRFRFDDAAKPDQPPSPCNGERAPRKAPYFPSVANPLQTERRKVVGAPGFEPGTSCAQGRRATRLRYAPIERAES